MKRITEITKRDIFSIFTAGIDAMGFLDTERVKYDYFGRLDELEFLKRIYDLQKLPSYDSRLKNAEEDIRRHTIANDDWETDWIFRDERFELLNGTDEVLLRFLCEVFHPAVRIENGYWKEVLQCTNTLLKEDGYELYVASKSSGREVYNWKSYNPEENLFFIPFSQRHKEDISSKKLKIKLPRNFRNQIYQLFLRHTDTYTEIDDTGWNYNVTTSEYMFRDIVQFYPPKCYQNGKYLETSDLEQFLINTSPYCVLDAIEIYFRYSGEDFAIKVNSIMKANNIGYRLENGKIINNLDVNIATKDLSEVQEVGLKDLIEEAVKYYNDNNKKIAVEKLWDAFERLKTYYSPTLDKKHSVKKIIESMSNNQEEFRKMYDAEFETLTDIGNGFRIRHHETTKIEINDEKQYDYFYKRCLALISTAILYL